MSSSESGEKVRADTIRGRLVTLRPLRTSDSVVMEGLLRDGRVTRLLPPRVRREGGREYTLRVLHAQRQGEGFAFAIVRSGSRSVIGQISLLSWAKAERRAEVGFMVQRSHWGKGFGTEALRLVCDFGFRSIRLRRLAANVIEGNLGSARVLDKVGFRLEGTRRQAARVSRGWADVLEYGLLRREWLATPSNAGLGIDRP
jgi:[ribosomal protein S5]-alanine N-acetyltransferase